MSWCEDLQRPWETSWNSNFKKIRAPDCLKILTLLLSPSNKKLMFGFNGINPLQLKASPDLYTCIWKKNIHGIKKNVLISNWSCDGLTWRLELYYCSCLEGWMSYYDATRKFLNYQGFLTVVSYWEFPLLSENNQLRPMQFPMCQKVTDVLKVENTIQIWFF